MEPQRNSDEQLTHFREWTPMATDRQIDANRNNASRSTGPRTMAGKSRSRANATKHGMAGVGVPTEDERAEAFEARRAAWGDELRPATESADWALDRVIAATFRIERCEAAFNALLLDQSTRAKYAWDLDRRADSAAQINGLSRDPAEVTGRLETSIHGCAVLMNIWDRLIAAIDANGEWSDFETSTALDLLGLPADLRQGKTPLTPPDGVALALHLREVADSEVERLTALAEHLVPLDDLARRQAEAGVSTLLSRPAQLIHRYERDAWRQYRQSLRDLKTRDEVPTVEEPEIAPPPPVAPKPIPIPTMAARRDDPVSTPIVDVDLFVDRQSGTSSFPTDSQVKDAITTLRDDRLSSGWAGRYGDVG